MGAPDSTAAVMMTLAGIAYGEPSAIPGYLAQPGVAAGEWRVVWSPTQPDDGSAAPNFAFIARNVRSGDHVLAIRGTYPDPLSSAYWDDANEDSPFGDMQAWPGGGSGASVSAGTWVAFQRLTALQQGSQTLAQALQAIPADATLHVTGHSLGGTLAPVLALWITEQWPQRVPQVWVFAGMTPGNAAFAALFGPGTPLQGRVTRYSNTLDQVPYGWDRVSQTRSFYQPAPNGGLLVEGLIEVTALRLASYGFTAIGPEVALTGQLSGATSGCELVAYVRESLHQHLPDTYLGLLGAPPLPFQIGFGAILADRDGSVVRARPRPRA